MDKEGSSLDIKAGQILKIGMAHSVAINDNTTGFRLLVVLPFRATGLKVSRNDRRETGAFLLAPGEEVRLEWDDQKKLYRFELLPVISARVDSEDRCDFCRSAFRDANACLCTASTLEPTTVTPALLCEACAIAWGDYPPDEAPERQTH